VPLGYMALELMALEHLVENTLSISDIRKSGPTLMHFVAATS